MYKAKKNRQVMEAQVANEVKVKYQFVAISFSSFNFFRQKLLKNFFMKCQNEILIGKLVNSR